VDRDLAGWWACGGRSFSIDSHLLIDHRREKGAAMRRVDRPLRLLAGAAAVLVGVAVLWTAGPASADGPIVNQSFDRERVTVDNGQITIEFRLGGDAGQTVVTRVVVQVCRHAHPWTTVPDYCGRPVEYRTPPSPWV
jgi:hypothetical protein